MSKSIVCTVTTDLNYDQRMIRICTSLANGGYDVTLVGRKKRRSLALEERPFKQKRLNCWFQKGKLFYAEYNIRLYFYLLFHKFDIVCSIDLDSILPGYYISKLKGVPHVYDAHEYFTEMEEVVSRPKIKEFWQSVEQRVLPGLKHGYTVSEGYADLFKEKYGVQMGVVRNATALYEMPKVVKVKPYVLYQGAVNVGRGLHELINAMQYVDCQLEIAGKGDVFGDLQEQVKQLGLEDKVKFWGYVEPDRLRQITLGAHIGITLFSNDGLSNQYSLCNRFFDYMHAGVPQVAMEYPEYMRFNQEFEVARLIKKLDARSIANALNELLENQDIYYHMKSECLKAREVHNWQAEEKKLLETYSTIT